MLQDKDILEIRKAKKILNFFSHSYNSPNVSQGSILSVPAEGKGILQRGVEEKIHRLIFQHALSLYQ